MNDRDEMIPRAEAEHSDHGHQHAAEDTTPNGFVPLSAIHHDPAARLDMGAIREKLAGTRGKRYWRSLDEVAETPEFRVLQQREFPLEAPREMKALPRREFFRVMGATMAMAGLAGCASQPTEKIVPYVEQPEQLVPGKPLYFATAFTRGGYALGILAESQMGRPSKIEGNPQHPASLGATDVFAQASVLTLYDPDRSQFVRRNGTPSTWESFLGELEPKLQALRATRGAGLRIMTEGITSPTLINQLTQFFKIFPAAKLHQHEPAGRDAVHEGTRAAFGEELNPVYRFDRATTIVSLDSNFLADEPGSVRYSRDYMDARAATEVRGAHAGKPTSGETKMNRLYAVQSSPSLTGANADHAVVVKPSQVDGIARALAGALGVPGVAVGGTAPGVEPKVLAAMVEDLKAAGRSALVIAGPQQPTSVQVLAHAINAHLGSIGTTVTFTAPVEARFPAQDTTLPQLVTDMNSGKVELLLLFGVNPAYTAPADLKFAEAMEKVRLRVHLGLYDDETAALCQWHLPESHYLEAWSDARAYDGTISVVQPLILPLYPSHSLHEVLAAFLHQDGVTGYDIVRGYWMGRTPQAQFDNVWHQALVNGTVPNSALPAKTAAFKGAIPPSPPTTSGLEVAIRPDPHIGDGRFANNGWLQELPKPLTTLTWDNAAVISPKTAEANHLGNGELVVLSYKNRTLKVPVWILPGHPDETLSLTLGYGRTRAGKLGTKAGFNAYSLLTSDSPWNLAGVEMAKAGDSYPLSATQTHFSLEGRNLVRVGTLEEYAHNPHEPEFAQTEEDRQKLPSLFPQGWPSDRNATAANESEPTRPGTYVHPDFEPAYNGEPMPAWGMVIDLNACTGCNACTIACQAENNIATVGKDQVAMHRQMHWIRVDTYYTGTPEAPETAFQPVPCMHCEKAPCEPVCPVEATTHSAEGINEMTYNRCVGTRYCSNNCPYKVRHFNYFQYSEQQTPVIQMQHNPDVTVRSRGVMEKCTYCVQRVNEARIQAEKEERPIRDGDVVSACQQVCPTRAITFGDIHDQRSNNNKGSRVRQLKDLGLNYTMLTELNTRPRTSYLARLRNPHPSLAAEAGAGEKKAGE